MLFFFCIKKVEEEIKRDFHLCLSVPLTWLLNKALAAVSANALKSKAQLSITALSW